MTGLLEKKTAVNKINRFSYKQIYSTAQTIKIFLKNGC
jgi:hypothetical protein